MLLADIQSLTSHLAPPKVPQGLQPPALNESVHTVRCLQQLRSKDKSLEKYIYLTQLKDADERMFYKICLTNMSVSCRDNFLGHKRPNYLIFLMVGNHASHLHTHGWRRLPTVLCDLQKTGRSGMCIQVSMILQM